MRWALYLQGFNMKIETIKGRENNAADFLNRSIDYVDNGNGAESCDVSTQVGVV